VGAFSVKIQALKDHLSKNPKDMKSKRNHELLLSKRKKMLKYLRRQDIAKFVKTCQLVGVEPDTIRATGKG
jgi:small subunit ribosomal protein S15